MVAWIQDEPAAPAVERFFEEAESGGSELYMSMLNVGETFYILAKRKGMPIAERFLRALPSMPIRIVVPDKDGIMAAARIEAMHPIAYGDSFAIALAQIQNAIVVTGDNEIRQCGVVPVDWVGDGPQVRV